MAQRRKLLVAHHARFGQRDRAKSARRGAHNHRRVSEISLRQRFDNLNRRFATPANVALEGRILLCSKTKLAINLITYNRAQALDRTLQELRQSPFANCRKITVLDNCSTDDTRLQFACANIKPIFPRYIVLRHPKNIGLSANYLRAVEVSEAPYTWILCDDDSYDWSGCDDVIQEIEAGNFDWICVGAPGRQQSWERGLKTTTQAIVAARFSARFSLLHTFVPSLIFKTATFRFASA